MRLPNLVLLFGLPYIVLVLLFVSLTSAVPSITPAPDTLISMGAARTR